MWSSLLFGPGHNHYSIFFYCPEMHHPLRKLFFSIQLKVNKCLRSKQNNNDLCGTMAENSKNSVRCVGVNAYISSTLISPPFSFFLIILFNETQKHDMVCKTDRNWSLGGFHGLVIELNRGKLIQTLAHSLTSPQSPEQTSRFIQCSKSCC